MSSSLEKRKTSPIDREDGMIIQGSCNTGIKGDRITRERLVVLLILIILLLLWPVSSPAHGLRVFAWVSGETVTVESSFSGGRSLVRGEVTVSAAPKGQDSGIVLVRGVTGPDGTFCFPLPATARTEELLITVSGGEGHQAQWLLQPQKTEPARPTPNPEKNVEESLSLTTTARSSAVPSSSGLMRPEDLKRLDQLLDEKLAPIHRDLARLQTREPDLRDILGGIGYLLGLAGLLAWAKTRKK